MRTSLSRLLALTAILFTLPATAQEVLNGIAAVVNKDVITFAQVRELVGAREQTLQKTYSGEELVTKIKETRLAALNELIDRQLIIQDFKTAGFTIPAYVVEDRVGQIIREEFGGDRAAFLRTLEAQGFTLQRFKEQEEEKIVVQAMRQKNVQVNTVLSPQQVQAFFTAHSSEYETADQAKLRMIVLKGTDDLDAAKRTLEEIRQKIMAGAEFGRMAQMYSDDSTKESEGDWGWIDRNTLNEELTKAAFSLKPGETSPVIALGGSVYLLFVEARKYGGVKPLAEVRDDIEKKLLQERRQAAQEKWLKGLRAKAYIKIL